jgi:hypothetical protein
MNSNTQAQKGFKTFILTLVISLVVFSAIYYIINTEQPEENIVEQPIAQEEKMIVQSDSTAESATLGETDTRSVFGELAAADAEDYDVQPKQVLSGATETTQSTVPDTGFFGPTFGLLVSTITLGIGAYLVFLGPRKTALASFEKNVIRDLD